MKTTFLSEALQDFYERKGGRIFFQNGMSLNQLALEMWERLEYQGVDPSVISRVLKGERLFTPRQLKVFISVLKIPYPQKKSLSELLLKDVASRFGFAIDASEINSQNSSRRLIRFISDSVNPIEKIRVTGLPEVVQNLTDTMLEFSEEAGNLGNLSDAEKYQLSKTQAMLLYEKIYSIIDTCFASELIEKTSPLLKKLNFIVCQLREDDLKSRLCLLRTHAYAVLGRYRSDPSHRIFHFLGKIASENGLKMAKDPEVEFKLTGRLIESGGYLQDKNFLKKEGRGKVLSLLEAKGSQYPAQACLLLNNIAVANSFIKEKDVFSFIEKGWEIYRKNVGFQPRLEARLIRSTLQTMVNFQNRDLVFAGQLIKRMEILSQLGFKRHWLYSQKYLKSLINLSGKNRQIFSFSP